MSVLQKEYKLAIDNKMLSAKVSEQDFENILKDENMRREYWNYCNKKNPSFYADNYDHFSMKVDEMLGVNASTDNQEAEITQEESDARIKELQSQGFIRQGSLDEGDGSRKASTPTSSTWRGIHKFDTENEFKMDAEPSQSGLLREPKKTATQRPRLYSMPAQGDVFGRSAESPSVFYMDDKQRPKQPYPTIKSKYSDNYTMLDAMEDAGKWLGNNSVVNEAPEIAEAAGKGLTAGVLELVRGLASFGMQVVESGIKVDATGQPLMPLEMDNKGNITMGEIRGISVEEQRAQGSLLAKAEHKLKELSDDIYKDALPDIAEDEGFIDLISDGRYLDALKLSIASTSRSVPYMAASVIPGGGFLMGTLDQANRYVDSAQEHPDMNNAERLAYAIGGATIEQLIEKYTNPFKGLKGATKAEVKRTLKEIEASAEKAVWKRVTGNIAKETVSEGAEELATSALTDLFGTMIDLEGEHGISIHGQYKQYAEQMRAKNPNMTDEEIRNSFVKIKTKEYSDALILGSLGGAYISTTSTLATTNYAKADKEDSKLTLNALDATASESGTSKEDVLDIVMREQKGNEMNEEENQIIKSFKTNYAKAAMKSAVKKQADEFVSNMRNKTDDHVYEISFADGSLEEGDVAYIVDGNVSTTEVDEKNIFDTANSDKVVHVRIFKADGSEQIKQVAVDELDIVNTPVSSKDFASQLQDQMYNTAEQLFIASQSTGADNNQAPLRAEGEQASNIEGRQFTNGQQTITASNLDSNGNVKLSAPVTLPNGEVVTELPQAAFDALMEVDGWQEVTSQPQGQVQEQPQAAQPIVWSEMDAEQATAAVVERNKGNKERAKKFAEAQVKVKEKALKDAQKELDQVAEGGDIDAFNAAQDKVDAIQAEVDKWYAVANGVESYQAPQPAPQVQASASGNGVVTEKEQVPQQPTPAPTTQAPQQPQQSIQPNEPKGDGSQKITGESVVTDGMRTAQSGNDLSKFAKKLGAKGVHVVSDKNQLPKSEGAAYRAIKSGVRVMGWWNPANNQVYIYTPNATSVEEVKSALLHEFVSHRGLREMLGKEEFDNLCRKVWDMMSDKDKLQYAAYVKYQVAVNSADMDNLLARMTERQKVALLNSKNNQLAAADEYMAHIADTGVSETERTIWQKICDLIRAALRKVGIDVQITDADIANLLRASSKRLSTDGSMADIANTIYENKDKFQDKVEIDSNGKGGVLYSITTDPQVLEQREKQLKRSVRNGVLSKQEAEEIRMFANTMRDLAEAIATAKKDGVSEFPTFSEWNGLEVRLNAEGNPVVSVIKSNGEYPMNIDFAKHCVKRNTLNGLMDRLAETSPELFANLTKENIAKINEIVDKHGLAIPCLGCYVEARRFRSPDYARAVIKVWNDAKKAIKEGKEGAFIRKHEKVTERKVLQYLQENPNEAVELTVADFLSPTKYAQLMMDHPKIPALLQATQGQNNTFLVVPEAIYFGEVLNQDWGLDEAYSVGGVRMQSFSDFQPKLFFDYCQVFADLASKRLPVHSYTKVPSFAELFGLNGAKINLSLYYTGTGLDEDGNYTYSNESIDPEFAFDLQSRDGYTKNVGTMAMGISDMHIWKLLKDPNIRSITPYHKSSIAPEVAAKLGIKTFTDYSNEQYTSVAKSAKQENESWQEYYARITERKNGKVPEVGKKAERLSFNMYDSLLETENPIQTSKDYVEYCQANGLVPKFASFVYNADGSFNEDYYKLLFDFSVTDRDGVYAPQGAVKSEEGSMPTNTAKLLKGYLTKEDAGDQETKAALDAIAQEVRESVMFSITEDSESQVRYSIVTDKKKIEELEASEKMKGYRTVILNEDGTFSSPMATGLGNKGKTSAKTSGFELDKWEQAEERPGLADENGKINLKPKEGGDTYVDYNPYIHNRLDKINTQFTSAWRKPFLVYIETEIPMSDIESGYHAEKAALSVGVHPWNGGDLVLSRYDKPVRIVPWEEVADDWVKAFKNRGVEFDIVPPALLPILHERGVEILPPHKNMGEECNAAYAQWRAENSNPRFSISSIAEDAWNKYQYDGELESIRDVANYIEENMPKNEQTQALFDAIEAYNIEELEDRELYGMRGDLEPFADAILEELETLMNSNPRFSISAKEQQLEIINSTNPMRDDIHTGIRSVEDIHTLSETMNGELLVTTNDWSEEDIQRAIDTNEVTLYSSNPIVNGAFVTPSKQIAQDYAGNGQVYEKTTSPDNVAWIDSSEGQYADVRFSVKLTKEQAEKVVQYIKDDADSFKDVELTPSNWVKLFGEDGTVETPLGKVKMGENQYIKMGLEGRSKKLGMVKPTLENPSVIVEAESKAKEGQVTERDYSYIFIKAFVGKDGNRMYYFTSVTVKKDSQEVVISNQEKSENKISKLLTNGKLAWIKDESSLYPKTQIEESVPLNDSNRPTTSDNQSALLGISSPELADKGTKKMPNDQINSQENANLNGNDILFSISNERNAIFISNAEKAVESIKQEKATPQQWKAMIEKQGGLKAGEDKWLGLSEWLDSKVAPVQENETMGEVARRVAKNTITKQEILDYIAEHQIQIEEVEYGEYEMQDVFEDYRSEYKQYYDEAVADNAEDPQEDAWQRMIEEHGEDFSMGFYAYGDELQWDGNSDYVKWELENSSESGLLPINDTRMQYTTKGLENKREIALVVPTIESWNEGDDIHFGDAGEGRAIAWIRFGETEAQTPREVIDHVDELQFAYTNANGQDVYAPQGSKFSKDYAVYGKLANGEMGYVLYVRNNQLSAHPTLEAALEALNAHYEANPRQVTDYGKVLVIDEIQSKRHQEGREKGYATKKDRDIKKKIAKLTDQQDAIFDAMRAREEGRAGITNFTEEETAELKRLGEEIKQLQSELSANNGIIPDAPFDKNWHELAFKRMLRYAAENGYDYVAWTTGEQQAERYNLGKQFDYIEREDNPSINGRRFALNGANYFTFVVNEEGIVTESDMSDIQGKPLADVVGKDLAIRMMSLEDGDAIENADLRIGGEGMKGFYDKMLPSFVSKYVKKWGAKVGEVTMPQLQEGYQTMHSVDVTEEMKESVMQGQPMFSIRNRTEDLHMSQESVNFANEYRWGDTMRDAYNIDRAKFAEELELFEDAQLSIDLAGVVNGKRLTSKSVGFFDQKAYALSQFFNKIADSKDKPVVIPTHVDIKDYLVEAGISEEIADAFQQEAKDIIKDGDIVKGLHYNGTIVVVGEFINSLADAKSTYAHELQHKENKRNADAVVNAIKVSTPHELLNFVDTLQGKGLYAHLLKLGADGFRALADEVIAYGVQYGYRLGENGNLAEALRESGLTNEKLINIITQEYERQKESHGNLIQNNRKGNSRFYNRNNPRYNRANAAVVQGESKQVERTNGYGLVQGSEGTRQGVVANAKALQELRNEAIRLAKENLLQVEPMRESGVRFAITSAPTPSPEETKSEYLKRYMEWRENQVNEIAVNAYKGELKKGTKFWRTFVKKIVDRNIAIEKFQEFVLKISKSLDLEGKISINTNAFLDVSMAAGRADSANERFKTRYQTPMMDAIKAIVKSKKLNNIDIRWNGIEGKKNGKKLTASELVGIYCQAKDVQEAIEMGLPDRGQQGFKDNLLMGSDEVSHEDVIRIVEDALAGTNLKDNLWKAVNQATLFSLIYQRRHRFISRKTFDEYKSRKFYVPERGWRERDLEDRERKYVDDKGNEGRMDSPFNVALKKAKGRSSLASDPFAYIVSIAKSTIAAVEKNRVKQKFLQFLFDNDQVGLNTKAWTIKQVYLVKVKNKDGKDIGTVATYEKPSNPDDIAGKVGNDLESLKQLAQNQKNQHAVVVVKDGEEYVIWLEDEQLANALNRNYAGINFQNSKLGRAMRGATGYYSGQLTQYNPEFAASNFVRDYILSQISNFAVQDKPFEHFARFNYNLARIMPELVTYVGAHTIGREAFLNTKKGKYMQEYFALGAQTGFSYLEDVSVLRDLIDKVVNKNDIVKYASAVPKFVFMDMLSALTELSELSIRMTQYITCREKGMSARAAAIEAKKITVDFDTKGELSSVFSGLWSFFNASVQGTNKIARDIKRKPLRATLTYAGFAGLLFYLGYLLTNLFPDDPEEEEFWNEYVRRTNITGGEYKIPMAHFFRIFWGGGVTMALKEQGRLTETQAAGEMTRMVFDEIIPQSPFQIQNLFEYNEEADSYDISLEGYERGLMPSVFMPIYDVKQNEDFLGRKISKEPYTKAEEGKYKAKKYERTESTNEKYIKVADWLSGGDPNVLTKGVDDGNPIDINGTELQYIVEGYTKQFATLVDTYNLVTKAINEEEIQTKDIPFLRKFKKDYMNESAYNQEYWTLYNYMEQYKAQRKEVGEDANPSKEEFYKNIESSELLKNKPKGGETPQEVKELMDLNKQWRKLLDKD